MDARVILGQQGRIVIPSKIRAALGLTAGDQLHLRFSGKHLTIGRPADVAAELRGLASEVPSSRSLVDELLAERRAAAAVD